jgi:hypothetical protein
MSKKYSIHWENDQIVSVEVDGVAYAHTDQVPDPADRAQIERLIARSSGDDFDEDFDTEFDQKFESEFKELEKQSARLPVILVGIFLAVGVLMLVIAALATVSTLRTLSREVSAPGEVVDLVVRPSQDAETGRVTDYTYPVVDFYLPDETHLRFELNEGSSPPSYEIGDQVTILYDPDHPRQARIKSFSSTILMWILPAITGLVGVVFSGVSVAAWWFLVRKSDQEP